MISIGFVNPQAQAVVFDLNIHTEDKIVKITSYKDGLPTYTKLEGLKFSYQGIIKEFPDLADKTVAEAKVMGLERFKEHLKKFKTERELVMYLVDDLKKHNYEARQIIKKGFRPMTIKTYLAMVKT